MSTICVTCRLPASALALLREAGDVHVLDRPVAGAPWSSVIQPCEALVCLLTDAIDGDALEAAGPSLKVVANVAVGYNNINLEAARERDIIVTNTPGVLTGSVAEFTWAMIFAVTRRLGEGERLVRRGEWQGWALDLLTGMELDGKQLGIVGAGRIGRAVAERAGAFGMQVVFAGRSSSRAEPVDGHPVVSFDELLVGSDVVSLHVPLTAETTHLIDRRALARMRRTAYLINTARGPVVDEAALVWALEERLIAGAALDVYEREPELHPGLLSLEQVVLQPHTGSATRETRTAMAELAARNVQAVLRGEPPLTSVG
jgi:lactate dehydrogenase-like 2-hydroxyacid dehydrogenase